MRTFALITVLVATAVVGGFAQASLQQQTDIAEFEVASIKRSPPDATMMRPGSPDPGGRWLSLNATLLMVMQRVYVEYDLPGHIVGGPGWVRSERFDIDARAGRDVPRAQVDLMVQRLLADRFKLKVHPELRPVDVYALVVARGDGRLGRRLKPASAECVAAIEAAPERTRVGRVVVLNSAISLPCRGEMSRRDGVVRIRGGREIGSLLAVLQAWMDRRIVDRTGLQGFYEMDLEFDFASARSVGVADAADPGGLSIFTALQEQLGLKLEPRREPSQVLVIDAVEHPTPN